jgi:2-desacetyl-2-hydroxyethyl bacteriochlorophyllide A dehydrogenase
MKAIQLRRPGNVALVDVPVPTPQPDQLLIRTGASVICTSDLNDIRENPFHIPLPVVLGHEGAGTVAAVGRDVRGFAPGDRVATHPVHPCRACRRCQAGMGHLCLNMGHFGLNMPGTFADYYVVRQDRARVVPPDVPFELAALAEPVCVCLQALAQARLDPSGTLLILGDGPFGVLTATLATASGLNHVVLAGHHDYRLAFARTANTVNVKGNPDVLAALRSATLATEYDAAILAVGNPAAVGQALQLVRAKGRVVIFSAVLQPMPLDLFTVHVRELEIVGACNDQDRLDEAVRLLSHPSLALGSLVTHRFTATHYDQALRTAADAHDRAMKVALLWQEQTPS